MDELEFLFSNIKINDTNEYQIIHSELKKIKELQHKIRLLKQQNTATIKDFIRIINMENILKKLTDDWNKKELAQQACQEQNIYNYYRS